MILMTTMMMMITGDEDADVIKMQIKKVHGETGDVAAGPGAYSDDDGNSRGEEHDEHVRARERANLDNSAAGGGASRAAKWKITMMALRLLMSLNHTKATPEPLNWPRP